MADTYTIIRGNNIKLIDNGDGTYSLSTSQSGTITANVAVTSSALPTGAATAANQTTLIAKDFATQTTLASLLAQADIKISVLRDALLGVNSKTLSDLEALLTAIKDTGGIKKITDALPAGSNNIGKVDVNSSALPTGAATAANQTSIIDYVDTVETLLTAIKDTGGIKKITDTVNVLQTGSSSMSSGVVNVTTAGTRVQLSDIACREVIIIAKRTNTGYIYVAGDTVSSTSYGAELAAKDSITIPVNNVNKIYIDSSVSGEGISYVAV